MPEISQEEMSGMALKYLTRMTRINPPKNIEEIQKKISEAEKTLNVDYETAFQFVKQYCSLSDTLDETIRRNQF